MLNKHIVILADDYPSAKRQVFVFVEQLVVALVDLGVKVSVIAPQSLTRFLFRGVKLLPLKCCNETVKGNHYMVYRPYCISFGNGRRALYKLAKMFNQRRLMKIINEIDPDILYGHFWHNALRLNTFSRKNSLPLFVACGEGDDALENLDKYTPKTVMKSFTDNVTGVICVSSDNKNRCLTLGLCDESKVIVLPNAADNMLFFPKRSEKKRKELGIEENDFVIAFSGAFIHRKGADRLAEAINKINDPHIKSIFIGKPLKGDMAMPSCKGIVFQGQLPHNLIPEYLNCADVFVLPTLKEGCSNAIIEALSCGIPVISSDRAFNYDILNEHNSVLIDPSNIDDIVSAICKMKLDTSFYFEKRKYTLEHSSDYSILERANRICQFIIKKSNN